MIEPVKVVINGNNYTVNPLNPIEIIDVYGDYIAAIKKEESTARFMRKAIYQCLDPMNRELSDPLNFSKWFDEHPEDLLELGVKAWDAVILPFVRNPKDTKKNAKS